MDSVLRCIQLERMDTRRTKRRNFSDQFMTKVALQALRGARVIVADLSAERLAVGLAASEAVNPAAVRYLNRLSDWFFVAARMANDEGRADVLWVPGANR